MRFQSRLQRLCSKNSYAFLIWKVLSEAIKADENRVNIKKAKSDKPNRSYILELDERQGENFCFTTDQGVIVCWSDPDKNLDIYVGELDSTLFEKIKADVQQAEDALFNSDFTDKESDYERYFDVGSIIDWYLVNEITKNVETAFFNPNNPNNYIYSSIYLYYEPSVKKVLYGVTLGFWYLFKEHKLLWVYHPEGFHAKPAKWISRLFEDPAFTQAVKERWDSKKGEIETIFNFIDQRAEALDEMQHLNFAIWDILNQYVWPNAVVKGSYQGEIE